MTKVLSDWSVMEDDGDYVVLHYVGGESVFIVEDYYQDRAYALYRADKLNGMDVIAELVGGEWCLPSSELERIG